MLNQKILNKTVQSAVDRLVRVLLKEVIQNV